METTTTKSLPTFDVLDFLLEEQTSALSAPPLSESSLSAKTDQLIDLIISTETEVKTTTKSLATFNVLDFLLEEQTPAPSSNTSSKGEIKVVATHRGYLATFFQGTVRTLSSAAGLGLSIGKSLTITIAQTATQEAVKAYFPAALTAVLPAILPVSVIATGAGILVATILTYTPTLLTDPRDGIRKIGAAVVVSVTGSIVGMGLLNIIPNETLANLAGAYVVGFVNEVQSLVSERKKKQQEHQLANLIDYKVTRQAATMESKTTTSSFSIREELRYLNDHKGSILKLAAVGGVAAYLAQLGTLGKVWSNSLWIFDHANKLPLLSGIGPRLAEKTLVTLATSALAPVNKKIASIVTQQTERLLRLVRIEAKEQKLAPRVVRHFLKERIGIALFEHLVLSDVIQISNTIALNVATQQGLTQVYQVAKEWKTLDDAYRDIYHVYNQAIDATSRVSSSLTDQVQVVQEAFRNLSFSSLPSAITTTTTPTPSTTSTTSTTSTPISEATRKAMEEAEQKAIAAMRRAAEAAANRIELEKLEQEAQLRKFLMAGLATRPTASEQHQVVRNQIQAMDILINKQDSATQRLFYDYNPELVKQFQNLQKNFNEIKTDTSAATIAPQTQDALNQAQKTKLTFDEAVKELIKKNPNLPIDKLREYEFEPLAIQGARLFSVASSSSWWVKAPGYALQGHKAIYNAALATATIGRLAGMVSSVPPESSGWTEQALRGVEWVVENVPQDVRPPVTTPATIAKETTADTALRYGAMVLGLRPVDSVNGLHAVLGATGFHPRLTQSEAVSQIFIGPTATKFVEDVVTPSWWNQLFIPKK